LSALNLSGGGEFGQGQLVGPPDDGNGNGERDNATPVEVPTEITGGVLRIDPETIRELADMGNAAPVPVAQDEPLSAEELREAWPVLDLGERSDGLKLLEQEDAEELFISLQARDQRLLLLFWRPGKRRSWIRLLEPDDVADVIQDAPDDERAGLMGLLDEPTRKEVSALLAYNEDEAGGLMNTRYARLRPNMTADQAISYLRRQAKTTLETIYYAYVLDPDQKLLGVVSFRDLLSAQPGKTVSDIMEVDVVRANEGMDQETLSRVFVEQDLPVIPVVDDDGVMKGIVTVDDIVDVVEEEATEDIQKFGGMEALEQPYLESSLREMIKKRGVWLTVLLFGGMLTTSALAAFQNQLDQAVVLTLFMPLIIASGGNSGSQASTLVIRAMALDEVRGRDWWRVLRRELMTGLALGAVLGALGLLRVVLWPGASDKYGEHYLLIAITVSISLICVVIFGTIAGSMLPFILKKCGADPASASAPAVATLVDVSGLILYLTVANIILSGTML
jgi:magnesium transporter